MGAKRTTTKKDTPAEATPKANGRSLYDLLKISSDAAPAEVRKAYLLRARDVHPDKNPLPEAHTAFLELQKAYEVLSNPERRKIYDTTGSTGEDGSSCESARMGPKISKEDIESFAATYKGSDIELQDIEEFLMKTNGAVEHFFEYIPFADAGDADRLTTIMEGLLSRKPEIFGPKKPTTAAIKKKLNTAAKKWKKFTDKEAKESEKEAESSMDSLVAMIQRRKSDNASFLDALEAKYTAAAPAPKRKKVAK